MFFNRVIWFNLLRFAVWWIQSNSYLLTSSKIHLGHPLVIGIECLIRSSNTCCDNFLRKVLWFVYITWVFFSQFELLNTLIPKIISCNPFLTNILHIFVQYSSSHNSLTIGFMPVDSLCGVPDHIHQIPFLDCRVCFLVQCCYNFFLQYSPMAFAFNLSIFALQYC